MEKIIYLRVSKEELDESTQLPKILERFNIDASECLILREKISAYSASAQEKRFEYIRLKQLITEGVVKDLYVFSVERLERNIDRFVAFYKLCRENNVRINSVSQPSLRYILEDDTPFGKFIFNIVANLYGVMGENESWMISQRTKKSVEKQGNVSYSYKGNKWGRKFTATNGKKVDLNIKEVNRLQRRIKKYKEQKLPYDEIIKIISKECKVIVSKTYISTS